MLYYSILVYLLHHMLTTLLIAANAYVGRCDLLERKRLAMRDLHPRNASLDIIFVFGVRVRFHIVGLITRVFAIRRTGTPPFQHAARQR